MNVLSLFDGISCGKVALERAGIKIKNYQASEVDKYAIQIAKKNHPDIEHLGDVQNWRTWAVPNPDLLIGGSPCQGFSMAGKQLNFNDPRSKLFFEFVDIMKATKPTYFLLENVKMKKEYQDIITEHMGVEPIKINSSLVSAQSRERLYWTNIPNVTIPEDRGIMLKDILEEGYVDRDKSFCIDASYYKGGNLKSYFEKNRRQLVFNKPVRIGDIGSSAQAHRVYSTEGKSVSLKALGGGQGAKTGLYYTNDIVRKLTPIECERLQTLPDNYTEGVSNTQRYKMLGNGWTVDVLSHIFKNIE